MNHLVKSAIIASSLLLTSCISDQAALQMGMKGVQALTLTDQSLQGASEQSCQEMDQKHQIAPDNSSYGRRLAAIKKGLPTTVNGVTLNYRVYQKNEANAWAMPNGCIRIYSGLMDLMSDDEVRGVLGHEIGHVALGHTKNRFRTAMLASLGRDILSSGDSRLAVLSRSQLGALGEGFLNAQFSQRQELEADNYSFELLTRYNYNPIALATAFDKLAKMGGGNSLFSSHPAPAERAERIRNRIQ